MTIVRSANATSESGSAAQTSLLVNVADHGVVGDAKTINGHAIASGASSFTLNGASMTSADIGKSIVLYGAGPARITGAPVLGTPSPSTAGGFRAAGTWSYIVTAYCGSGESAGSSAQTATTTGTTSSVTLTWTMATKTNVIGYRIYAGVAGSEYFIGYVEGPNTLTFVDTGQQTRDLWNTFVRPPTINCSPSPLVTTVSSVSGQTIGIAAAASTAASSTRTVTDANLGRTVTDAVANAGSTTVTSAAGSFAAIDIGRRITIAGAGASGGSHTSTITGINSSTSIAIGGAAISTVSSATMTIRDNALTSATAAFTAADQDRTISVSGLSVGFGTMRIHRVLSATTVLLETVPDTPLANATATIPYATLVWGTNNTAGLTAVRNLIASNATRTSGSPVFSGYGSGTWVHFPRGDYLITGDSPLIPTNPSRTVRGMRFTGESRDATNLLYAPGVFGGKMLRIPNNYMQTAFQDMTFTGLDRSAWWMHSSSDGAAQNVTYDRCGWFGRWYRGIGIDGTGSGSPDTNSEHTFNHCNIRAQIETFFLDLGLGTLTNTGSNLDQEDQFLNYWFNQTQFEVGFGGMVRANRGGNISITDGDQFVTSPQGGTIIDLRLASHGGAVRRFSWRGARLEPQRTYHCRMLWSEWGSGNILLDNLDTASTLGIYDAREQYMFEFQVNDVEGPQVVLRNSDVVGRMRFLYGTNSGTYRRRALVENCTIKQWREAHEYVTNSPLAGVANNAANAVPVEFRQCRGNGSGNGANYAFDVVLGSETTRTGATPQRRTTYVQNISGGIHTNAPTGVDLYLPRGAIITAIRLWMPAGAVASTSTTWQAKVQTTETTPRVLCQADGGSTVTLTTGFNNYVTEWGQLVGTGQVSTNLLPFYVGTGTGSDTLRRLQVVTNAGFDTTAASSFCIVDYIA